MATGSCSIFPNFHRFPQFFRIPPLPQTLSLPQLEPHCVNPATSIRITNKLSLTGFTIVLPYRLNSALQLGSLDSLSGFLRSLPVRNVSTSRRSNVPTVLHLPLCALNPLAATLAENHPVSPSIATDPKTPHSKSFACHTSETPLGCLLLVGTFQSKLHRIGGAKIPTRSGRSNVQRVRIYLVSFHTLAHSFALFCVWQKLNSFIFNLFRTLCPKTPGVGVPSQPQSGSESEPRRFFLAKDHSRCACQIAGGLLFGVV